MVITQIYTHVWHLISPCPLSPPPPFSLSLSLCPSLSLGLYCLSTLEFWTSWWAAGVAPPSCHLAWGSQSSPPFSSSTSIPPGLELSPRRAWETPFQQCPQIKPNAASLRSAPPAWSYPSGSPQTLRLETKWPEPQFILWLWSTCSWACRLSPTVSWRP